MQKKIDVPKRFHVQWQQLETMIRALDDAKTPDLQLLQATGILTQAANRLDAILIRMAISTWPEPTSDPPDLETLEQWMWEDGGCEATDSCWVEPDGRCPHGYPSWLLYLGSDLTERGEKLRLPSVADAVLAAVSARD